MSRSHTRPSRSAFTLIETVIAMSLLTLLMASLWTMFGVYTKLESKGVAAADKSALVRAIDRQLRSDVLHTVAIDPDLPVEDRSAAEMHGYPTNGFLVGTEHDLNFLIRGVNEFGAGRQTAPRVITYRPHARLQGDSVGRESLATLAGLDRLDRSWTSYRDEGLPDDSPGLSTNRAFSLDGDDLIEIGGNQTPAEQDESRTASIPDTIDEIPEVQAYRFRYFDGTSWVTQWDSNVRGRLPLAIELAFDIQMDRPPSGGPMAARRTSPESDQTASSARAVNTDDDVISIAPASQRDELFGAEFRLTVAIAAATPLGAGSLPDLKEPLP